jgi:hypothetical protein
LKYSARKPVKSNSKKIPRAVRMGENVAPGNCERELNREEKEQEAFFKARLHYPL